MLAVIDMKVGNLRSVLEGFARVGAEVQIAQSPADLEHAEGIVVPGVGAFGDGMACLEQQGWVATIRAEVIDKQKAILGICLGMQLLADGSEEHGMHRGLGLIRGQVVRLEPTEPGHRIPNMGWCDVTPHRTSSVLFGHSSVETFYFAHSYALACADAADIVATFDYGRPLTAAVERAHIFGAQFHPEKSQQPGLDFLDRFVRHVKRA